MTTTRPAPTPPRETSLQAEASAVEQLRRKIAEMSGRGEVATPQMLAEFARAQKAYLDNKIEFEKRRRAGEGMRAESTAIPVQSGIEESRGGGDSEAMEGSAAPETSFPPRTAGAAAAGKAASHWRTVALVILLAVLAGLAAAAWMLR